MTLKTVPAVLDEFECVSEYVSLSDEYEGDWNAAFVEGTSLEEVEEVISAISGQVEAYAEPQYATDAGISIKIHEF